MFFSRLSVFLTALLFLVAAGCGLTGSNSADPNDANPVLKVSEDADNPDAAIIPVKKEAISEQFRVFSFVVTAEGGSVTLRDVMIKVTASTPVSELVHNAELVITDSEFPLGDGLAGSEAETMLRFSLDAKSEKQISAGETRIVKLFVRFNPAENIPDDATIQASFDGVALHKSTAVNANGNELDDQHKVGVAEGGKHRLRQSGVYVQDGSTSSISAIQDDSTTATFTTKLEIFAFATDVYVRKATNRWTETVSSQAHSGFAFFIRNQDEETVIHGRAVSSLRSSGLLRTSSNVSTYRIPEGESETLTLETDFTVDNDRPIGFYRLQLDKFQYAKSEADVDQGAWSSHTMADTTSSELIELP